jgi:hypothetical protein
LLAAVLGLGTLPLAAGASGNGLGSESAAKIMSTAVRTTEGVPSFTLSGWAHQSGQTTTFHLSADQTGDLTADLGLQGKLSVIEKNGVVYFRADKTFWRQNGSTSAEVAQLANRWISAPASSATAQQIAGSSGVGALANLHTLFSKNFTGARFTKLHPSTFDGRPVLVVKVLNGTEAGDTVDIAATGPPYIVRIAQPHRGLAVFSHLGAPVHITPPTGAIPLPSA